jgi:choline/glycine/proline betaine transport protein
MKDLIARQWQKWTSAMDPYVFIPSAVLIILFVAIGSAFPAQTEDVFGQIQDTIATNMGWFYVLVTLSMLILCLYIGFSDWAHSKLGPPDSEPEHGRLSWLAMLFSAGMGTGLVFWSVAEPVTHMINQPPDAVTPTENSVRTAMLYSFFHWGLHPWSVYCIFALGIAFYHFRLGKPLAPRSLLHPLTNGNVDNVWGRTFDVICTVGTLFGVATSLGLGAMQINSGLQEFTDLSQSTIVQVAIIAAITLVATISVVSGIDKGIKRLSQANILLALLLTILIFILGPWRYIMHTLISSFGSYLQYLPKISTHLSIGGEGLDWQTNWTFFYWGWWISWSPFVGVFVARISRGRTVREFIFSVLFIPTVATCVWLAIYGGTAIYHAQLGNGLPVDVITSTPAKALHLLLNELPFGNILGPVATLLIIIFFITSSDSGSLVDDMVTSGGHPNPPTIQRIFWAVSEGLVAMTLLIAGGLKALQTASITAGLPMAFVLVITSLGLLRQMQRDAWEAPDD